MTGGWLLSRGTAVVGVDGVRFSVWAPACRRVGVRIFHGDAARCGKPHPARYHDHALEKTSGGVFEGTVRTAAAGTDYLYVLDGDRVVADPVSRYQPQGVHGPSRVVDPKEFDWTDGNWRGIERRDLVIYELHVGTFTPAGAFEGVIERLPYLSELGVTAIELMPVAQFPGRRNWGYDGVFSYAPQNTYGGPEGLKRLVDAAHAAGLAVLLDVVYNHLGPEGNVLNHFGPFFTDRFQTPWGQAINFDGPDSDEVRRYFIDNACYWISEFHMDGLRLDAVHAIYDFGAFHILEEMTQHVHRIGEASGQTVHLIAESDLNDPRLVRRRQRGGYRLDAQWTDDFQHAVHAVLTGEKAGYYADFGGVAPIAKAVEDRFVLDGRYSTFRRRRHGASAADVERDRFVVFIQNHDQVGNRAFGERLSALISPERQRVAACMLLLSPYIPLLFMGEEYGETRPFLYFVDHTDAELIEAVRKDRRKEFESFGWGTEIPDPQSEETFRRSRIDWGAVHDPRQTGLAHLYRDLLALRRKEPALRPGNAKVHTNFDTEAQWAAWILTPPTGRCVLAAFNLASVEQEVRIAAQAGQWTRLFSTEDEHYGGRGRGGEEIVQVMEDGAMYAVVPPNSAVVYTQTDRF